MAPKMIWELFTPEAEVRNQIERGPVLAPFVFDVLWAIEERKIERFAYSRLSPFDVLHELCRRTIHRHMSTPDTNMPPDLDLLPGEWIAHDWREGV